MPENDLALIGLAVMGQNLALNIARNGYSLAVYNRTPSKLMIYWPENLQLITFFPLLLFPNW